MLGTHSAMPRGIDWIRNPRRPRPRRLRTVPSRRRSRTRSSLPSTGMSNHRPFRAPSVERVYVLEARPVSPSGQVPWHRVATKHLLCTPAPAYWTAAAASDGQVVVEWTWSRYPSDVTPRRTSRRDQAPPHNRHQLAARLLTPWEWRGLLTRKPQRRREARSQTRWVECYRSW